MHDKLVKDFADKAGFEEVQINMSDKMAAILSNELFLITLLSGMKVPPTVPGQIALEVGEQLLYGDTIAYFFISANKGGAKGKFMSNLTIAVSEDKANVQGAYKNCKAFLESK